MAMWEHALEPQQAWGIGMSYAQDHVINTLFRLALNAVHPASALHHLQPLKRQLQGTFSERGVALSYGNRMFT